MYIYIYFLCVKKMYMGNQFMYTCLCTYIAYICLIGIIYYKVLVTVVIYKVFGDINNYNKNKSYVLQKLIILLSYYCV